MCNERRKEIKSLLFSIYFAFMNMSLKLRDICIFNIFLYKT